MQVIVDSVLCQTVPLTEETRDQPQSRCLARLTQQGEIQRSMGLHVDLAHHNQYPAPGTDQRQSVLQEDLAQTQHQLL